MIAKILAGLLGAALALLFLTKPSRSDFDAVVADTLRGAIGSSSVSNKREAFTGIRKALSISSADYFVVAHYEANGAGTDIACWGLLTKFTCSGGVSIPAAVDNDSR